VHVVVVGAGVAGLAAAAEATRLGADVTVLEGSSRVGGKVAVSEVGGLPVDEGADSMLTRVPDGIALAREAGLEDELVSPATGEAYVWSRGALRPLRPGRCSGCRPTCGARPQRAALRAGLNRVPLDLLLPGAPVTRTSRWGAGSAAGSGARWSTGWWSRCSAASTPGGPDRLSLRATLPQLVGAAARHRSLLLAAREARSGTPPTDGPLFASLPAGPGPAAGGPRRPLGRPGRARDDRAGAGPDCHRLAADHRLRRQPSSYDADAVVLAVPAAPAARLLAPVTPTAAAGLAALEYASVAIVTLVLDGPVAGARGSGYLVPAVEGRTTKAVTFSSRKWAHLAGPRSVLRASVGRAGETADLQRSDEELVEVVLSELARTVGPLPRVVDSRVVRWGGGLPQYAVGHLDLVRRVRDGVARQQRLAVAGAAYDGVGVPACAKSGRAAAQAVLGQNGRHDR
jgi:oxygen-dependent protoporphyrinogen oxidase